jgi:hypothetical protein
MTTSIAVPATLAGCSSARLSLHDVGRFHEDGFLGPFPLLSSAEAADLCSYVRECVLSTPGPNGHNEHGERDDYSCRHLDDLRVLEVCTSAALLDRVASLLGDDLLLFLTRFWLKQPNSGQVPWHQDATYWPIYPRVAVSAWLALTPATRENGCINFIRASQKTMLPELESHENMRFDLMTDPARFDASQAIAVPLRAGELVLFDANTLHQTDINRTRDDRLGIGIHFTAPLTRVEPGWFFAEHTSVIARGRDSVGINRSIALDQLRASLQLTRRHA